LRFQAVLERQASTTFLMPAKWNDQCNADIQANHFVVSGLPTNLGEWAV